VVVLNRERPTFVILNPEDHNAASAPARRGRPLREALTLLANAGRPDPAFGEDMEKVLGTVGDAPTDPWAHS
jgi:hypothetical protein